MLWLAGMVARSVHRPVVCVMQHMHEFFGRMVTLSSARAVGGSASRHGGPAGGAWRALASVPAAGGPGRGPPQPGSRGVGGGAGVGKAEA